MAETSETESVELSSDLISRVENRVKYTEFNSVADYISYVMEEVLYHIEQETQDEDLEDVDEQEVKDRLRSLGYLNE